MAAEEGGAVVVEVAEAPRCNFDRLDAGVKPLFGDVQKAVKFGGGFLSLKLGYRWFLRWSQAGPRCLRQHVPTGPGAERLPLPKGGRVAARQARSAGAMRFF
jgi:hypothetical protein